MTDFRKNTSQIVATAEENCDYDGQAKVEQTLYKRRPNDEAISEYIATTFTKIQNETYRIFSFDGGDGLEHHIASVSPLQKLFDSYAAYGTRLENAKDIAPLLENDKELGCIVDELNIIFNDGEGNPVEYDSEVTPPNFQPSKEGILR